MELVLQREGGGAGTVNIGGHKFYALENPDKQIPAGTYRVILTPSGRAQAGTLWTCWPDFLLPELLSVPGRTAIRIHAANTRDQLEGCIALGTDRTVDRVTLVHSRLALEDLAALTDFPCWFTIVDPVVKETQP